MDREVAEIRSGEEVMLLARSRVLSHFPQSVRDPAVAILALRRMARDRDVLRDLRRRWTHTTFRAPLSEISDDELLSSIEAGLRFGQFEIVVLRQFPALQGGAISERDLANVTRKPGAKFDLPDKRTRSQFEKAIPKTTPSAASPGPGADLVPVIRMSLPARISDVLRRAARKLPTEIGEALMALLDPESLAMMAGVIATSMTAELAPLGGAADAVILGIAFGFGGLQAIEALGLLSECFETIGKARDDRDLEDASDLLARAVVALGVIGLITILKKVSKRAPQRA